MFLSNATRSMRVSILALAILILAAMPAFAGSDESFIMSAHDADGSVVVLKPFVTLKPTAGMTLRFYALRNEAGRVMAVSVGQMHDARTAGISEIAGLRGADPLDMFYALSKPGAKIPAVLGKLYGQPTRGDQGWARGDLVADPDPVASACMIGSEGFGSFEDDVLDKGYPGLFLSDGDGPNTKPSHWGTDPGPADGTNWYRLRGGVTGVKAFYTKVQYCNADYNLYGNFEPDPVASVAMRLSGFGNYQQVALESFSEPGDELEYFSFPQTGASYDYRLTINLARVLDTFHIGATWSNPGGYIKS